MAIPIRYNIRNLKLRKGLKRWLKLTQRIIN